jgi:hypothetical protein
VGLDRRPLPNQLMLVSRHSTPSMTSHQFHVGQTVHLRPSTLARNAAAGAYEIRAVLPEQGGQHQYRIKSLIEPYERVVAEQELSEA